ncbi:MAG: sporulation protein YabP [Ruminococcaceae bacterium]|nr:sporulation protein YabP [Oscillospiraceae bacterium]
MQDNSIHSKHTLTLDNREKLILTGVTDVPGFDEETVSIKTDTGALIIKGESLHISRLSLDTGDVSIDGRINALQYLGDDRQKGFMSKIFR